VKERIQLNLRRRVVEQHGERCVLYLCCVIFASWFHFTCDIVGIKFSTYNAFFFMRFPKNASICI